jgi:hypothetical protein
MINVEIMMMLKTSFCAKEMDAGVIIPLRSATGLICNRNRIDIGIPSHMPKHEFRIPLSEPKAVKKRRMRDKKQIDLSSDAC